MFYHILGNVAYVRANVPRCIMCHASHPDKVHEIVPFDYEAYLKQKTNHI